MSGVIHRFLRSFLKIYRYCFLVAGGAALFVAADAQTYRGDNVWYFGHRAGLDFNNQDPFPLHDGQIDSPGGVAAISDTTGMILFYTDGVDIWNSSHQKINNQDLTGDRSSTQAATIVPIPDQPDEYFVFTTRAFYTDSLENWGGNYYIIRITSGGAGSIIYDHAAETGRKGFNSNLTEKFTAVPYKLANGSWGYWFLMHEFNNNRFVKVQYDGTFHDPVTQDIGSIHANDSLDDGTNHGAMGQMKANDLGTWLAVAVEGGHFFEVFTFNTETGMLSYRLPGIDTKLPAGESGNKFAYKYGAYGIEFSPTGRYGFEAPCGNYLYGSTRDGCMVYQWDLSLATDPFQMTKTENILYSSPTIEGGALQMAPNGKIYLALNGQDYLGVVSAPMLPFPDCGFSATGARLVDNDTGLGGSSGYGLPALTAPDRTPQVFYFNNLCFGDQTHFYITDQRAITLATPRAWQFTPLAGGNTVTKTNTFDEIFYKFPSPGDYRVRLTIFISGSPHTYERTLTIHPKPEVHLAPKDTVNLCVGSVMNLDAGPGAFYEWEDVSIKDRRRTIETDPGLPISLYRVKVTDYHGCEGWDTVYVYKQFPPTIQSTSSIKAFCGNQDGSATVIPVGDAATFNYQWEGYPDVNTNTLTGINGGDYVVHVISRYNACEAVDTIHVDEVGGSGVKILKPADTVCPGQPVTLHVTGAESVEWLIPAGSTADSLVIQTDTTMVVSVRGVNYDAGRECVTDVTDTIRVYPVNKPQLADSVAECAGIPVEIDGGENYTAWSWSDGEEGRFAHVREEQTALVLMATDFNGCVFSDTMKVHFNPAPVVNLGRDTAVCSPQPVTLSGGTGESYLWNTGATTQSILADTSGQYILTITEFGCSLSDTVHVQLNNPDLFKVDSISTRDISCFGADNGMIRVFASGDGRDFYYSIDDGTSYFENGGLFENLPPGDPYVIRVFEDSACLSKELPVTLSQPDTLIASFCPMPPSCADCNDGSITLVLLQGGTPPYVIRMNGEVVDSLVTSLGPGIYTMTVTDANECTATAQVKLDPADMPTLDATAHEPVCPGSAVLLMVGNSQMVEWIDPPAGNKMEVTVFPDTTTTYRVRSLTQAGNGVECGIVLEYTVEVIKTVRPELGDTILACVGDTVSLDGGDYLSWQWSNGANLRNIDLYSTISNLLLTVHDTSGCIMSDTVSVFFGKYPEVDLGKDISECTAGTVTLSGGTGDTYYWGPTGETAQEIEVNQSGKYTLTITTAGCSSSDSVNVRILNPDLLSVDSVQVTDNSCYGDSQGSILIFARGSGTSYSYSIDDGVTYQDSALFGNLPAGSDYRVRVREDSLCYSDYTQPVTVGQPDSILITYKLRMPSCDNCSDGKLILTLSGGTPPYQVTLNGAPIDLENDNLRVGPYVVLVSDANLCTGHAEFTLERFNAVPNVITTNGDGVNELWKIPMLQYYPDAIVKVFTSGGRLVYESQPGYPVPWDGRDHGTFLPMGTYYYLINLGPGEQQISGYLTILR